MTPQYPTTFRTPPCYSLRPVVWTKAQHGNGHTAHIGRIALGGITWRMSKDEQYDWTAKIVWLGLRYEQSVPTVDAGKAWVEAKVLALVAALLQPLLMEAAA